MNLRDILVFLDGGAASEQRLWLATSIARQHGACLSAVFLQDDRVIEIPRSTLPSETVRHMFRDCLRSFGGEGDWYPLDRIDTAELIALARAADLTIIGQANPYLRRSAPAWRPEKIVVACGRPVLMVPYIGSYDQVGRRVLVAWDGSREATRALNDALPVISDAETVTVMTVRARERECGRDHSALDRIIRHLTRHDMVVRAEETVRDGSAVSDMLLSRAADFAVDLIVAGASHHSAWHEALVGGVSRKLFQHMTVPVLMSH